MADDGSAVVKQFYALLAAGRADEALGLLAADIEWTEAERTPYYSGAMRGVAAVVSGTLHARQPRLQRVSHRPAGVGRRERPRRRLRPL